jgi:hypothetical protein
MASAGGATFAVGNHGIGRHDGERWLDLPPGPTMEVQGAYGTDAEHLIFVDAYGGVAIRTPEGWRYDQAHRDLLGRSMRTPGTRHRVAGSGPNDVWIAGQRGVLHWNGAELTERPGGGESILARGPNDVWLVGAGGLEHWDGATWTELGEPSEDAPEHAVLLDVGGELAAVGADLRRWSGSGWTRIAEIPFDADVLSAWASSFSDVYAVLGPERAYEAMESDGDEDDMAEARDFPILVHFDGTAWTEVLALHELAPEAVIGTSATDVVVAVDGDASFMVFAGETWSPSGEPFGTPMRALWLHEGAVFAAGDDGIAVRREVDR